MTEFDKRIRLQIGDAVIQSVAQGVQIEELTATVGEQTKTIAEQAKRIAELEASSKAPDANPGE